MRRYQIPGELMQVVFVDGDTTAEELQSYRGELKRRLDVLAQAYVRNILDYNAKAHQPLAHVIFIIPNAAKVKEDLYPVLLTLAAQGRPVGFFLFLGTQEGIPPALQILQVHAEHFASKEFFEGVK